MTIDPPKSGSSGPKAAERVLHAARELFYRQGIRAVGVDEIVSRAGVTKPSLYRGFASKDDLAASYLKLYEQEFWNRFDAALAAHPGDPRGGVLDYIQGLTARSAQPGYRGCGLSNAAVEYPEPDHPGRLVSEGHKRKLRERLQTLAAEMGADDPAMLGDGLMLLLEGTFVTGQILHSEGPAVSLHKAAERLIDACTAGA